MGLFDDWLDIDFSDIPEMKGDDPDWSSPTSMSPGDYATSLDQLWPSLFPEEGGDTGEFDWLDIDWNTPEMKGDDPDWSVPDEYETPGDYINFLDQDQFYFDPITGISKDDPFYIDFSDIPEMMGDDPDWSPPTSMSSGEYATYLDQLWPSLFPEETATGPFGGKIGPWLRNLFLGSGEGGILGGAGAGAGAGAAGEGGLGSFLSGVNPLLQFLAMKSLMKDDQGGGAVPVGGEAYGGPAFNYQDYQPTNLQPALMPGVGYANVGAPGMRAGGRSNGPGDITFAKLEPGEFVIQKPVVDAVGIERLEQLNNMFG